MWPAGRRQQEAATRSAALTSSPAVAPTAALTAGTIDGCPINYRQRLPIAGATAPLPLADGSLLDVARAAGTSLTRHRQLEREVAAAGAALLASPDTTEEVIETEHTVMVVAATHMVVADPAALRAHRPSSTSFDSRARPA